jgi:PAS domain S-box-containing protein
VVHNITKTIKFKTVTRKACALEIFEAFKGMYNFRELPLYAEFLLKKHLHVYSEAILEISNALNLPLLLSLKTRYSEQQIRRISGEASRSFLQMLAENRAYDQVRSTMERWRTDQLDVVGKMEVSGKDITLLNHARAQTLKKFLPLYTTDITAILDINSEIDFLTLGNTTSAMDSYIDILKSEVFEQSNFSTKLIKASPAVTFLFDVLSKRLVFVTGNAVEVMGFTPEEALALGDTFLQKLTHPDDLEMLTQQITSLIQDNANETRRIEYRFLHKDGSYRWLRTYEVIFKRDAAGNPLEVLGKTFEITHEKEIAMALQKREQQLLEAQAIAHIGSYEWIIPRGKSSNTEELNRIFDMEKDEVFEDFMSYVHHADKQKVMNALRRAFANGLYECEFRYVRNGIEKTIWSLGKVELIDQQPYRMVGTAQDITTFKKLEKELMEKSSELATSNESLRQFAFVASHDMKEPLRKIMMFSELVMKAESENISEKSLGQLQKMQNASRNLYIMIEDILSFSLLESKEKREKEKVSLSKIVDEVKDLLEETVNEKGACIISESLPEAEVIGSQIRQLLQNLIANSLKFSHRGEPPVIRIAGAITDNPSFFPGEKSGEYLEVSVEDNGIGFPEEAKEKIFELFSRYHSKSQYEGTGLGLSISKRIVENHHGIIRAFPGKERGARFVFVIPQ